VNEFTLLLIWCWPLLLATLAGVRHTAWTTVLAPLPALIVALAMPVGTGLSLPWLLLGTELGLDETGRVFLLFSSLLWLAASLYGVRDTATGHQGIRYRVLFLLAMAGNLGLIVAQDLLSFYLGFTLMGLAAYGLIAQPATRRARRAARRYLVWTIAGELALFVAVVMLAMQHGGAMLFSALSSKPPSEIAVVLLLAGFGIKLALPGLHFWLPQAYAVTPAAAVAVLSGAMIKAGLLGWLRFLPPGAGELAGWGQTLIIIGLVGTFFGVILGLLQQRPRLLLGYSSISKTGVLTLGVGAMLAWPEAAPALVSALTLYAAHHAMVKGGLFLGLGLVERGGLRPWLLAGLAFLAMALAGAPLTSGALAKSVLTANLPAEAGYLVSLLALSAFGTTLLMARFLWLVWRARTRADASNPVEAILAWVLLPGLVATVPFIIAETGQLSANLVPVSLAIILAALALAAAKNHTLSDAIRSMRHAAALPVLHTRRVIRHLSRQWQTAGEQIQTASHRVYTRLLHGLPYGQAKPRFPTEDNWRWQLAGGFWLTIALSILATFILAV
jgi:formate hydrogenlyase subunit 3/multisubunit Na+/H+ antiporter MnhD subunit